MTQAEKIIKIIMPDLLRYLNMKKSGIIAQKVNVYTGIYTEK